MAQPFTNFKCSLRVEVLLKVKLRTLVVGLSGNLKDSEKNYMNKLIFTFVG